jgi:hypothetical protein
MAAAHQKGVTEPSRSAQCHIAAEQQRDGYTGTRPKAEVLPADFSA